MATTLIDNINKLAKLPYAIDFATSVKRMNGEWEKRWVWVFGHKLKTDCPWTGFEDFESCVNHLILSIVNSDLTITHYGRAHVVNDWVTHYPDEREVSIKEWWETN